MRGKSQSGTVRRGRVVPRNIGPNARPRTDGSLTLLLPAVESLKPNQKEKAPPKVSRANESFMAPTFERVADPNAHKWTLMNTDYQMQTMMALSGDLVDKGDREQLVDFYDDFLGEGGVVVKHGIEVKQAPWRFWPGGWNAGQGWWEDASVNYSLEAVALKDEADAEEAMVLQKDRSLEESHERVDMANAEFESLRNGLGAVPWAELDPEQMERAEHNLVWSVRKVVPRRLHLVTAQLLRDVGEARRRRLRPQGRKGLPDVAAWHGVKVDQKIKKVCALALPYHNIKGPFAGAVEKCFTKLKGLAELHLVGNRLSGCIPDTVNNLRSLRLLLLRGNRLTGELPESLGELRTLVALDVAKNQIRGTLPASLEDLVNLQVLSVGDNRLGGPVQCLDGLTNLKKLRYLNIEANRFTGFLSCSFADMTKLRVLSLARNDLVGGVPRGLGELKELVSVDLSRNRFSGSLPFRPQHQPLLHQIKHHGNDDLAGPGLWIRHDTPRFQLERFTASLHQESSTSSSFSSFGGAAANAGSGSGSGRSRLVKGKGLVREADVLRFSAAAGLVAAGGGAAATTRGGVPFSAATTAAVAGVMAAAPPQPPSSTLSQNLADMTSATMVASLSWPSAARAGAAFSSSSSSLSPPFFASGARGSGGDTNLWPPPSSSSSYSSSSSALSTGSARFNAPPRPQGALGSLIPHPSEVGGPRAASSSSSSASSSSSSSCHSSSSSSSVSGKWPLHLTTAATLAACPSRPGTSSESGNSLTGGGSSSAHHAAGDEGGGGLSMMDLMLGIKPLSTERVLDQDLLLAELKLLELPQELLATTAAAASNQDEGHPGGGAGTAHFSATRAAVEATSSLSAF